MQHKYQIANKSESLMLIKVKDDNLFGVIIFIKGCKYSPIKKHVNIVEMYKYQETSIYINETVMLICVPSMRYLIMPIFRHWFEEWRSIWLLASVAIC